MCLTTYYLLWNDSDSLRWLPALSLPVLSWTKPFLPLVGLSEKLLQNLEIWAAIHHQAVMEEQERLRKEDWIVGKRGELTRQIVIQSLQQLADQVDRDASVELERWVRRHFFCLEVEIMLRAWRKLLRRACSFIDDCNDYNTVPLPAILVPLISLLEPLLGYEYQDRMWREIHLAALGSSRNDSHTRIEKDYEATMLVKVTQQALTITSLQTIATNLTSVGIQELIRWALLQASALQPPMNPVHLYGDKYLRQELPCFDTPSILDLIEPEKD